MPDFEFRYLLLGTLAIALLVAAFTDIRRREIDNWLNLAIAAVAPLFWWASGMSLWPDVAWQLGVAVITFAVLFTLFNLRMIGGGDVKLLTVLALWIAPLWFMRLLIVMSLVGGLLTVALWVHHRLQHRLGQPKIPYGVAIASAGLWVLYSQNRSVLAVSAQAVGLG